MIVFREWMGSSVAEAEAERMAQVMMMLVPEPWQNEKNMPEWKRAFYEYKAMQVCALRDVTRNRHN